MTTEQEHPSVDFYRRLLAFYTPRKALVWLVTPHAAFRDALPLGSWSPMGMIERGRADEVDAEIHLLETGAHV